MRNWTFLRGLTVGLFVCVGLVGLQARDAFAVAGKMTSAPPGVTALSGGTLTLELEEPVDGKTEFTVPVNQQGEFTTPAGVEERNINRCRYTNDKGETAFFRCGGYLAFGGGVGAAATTGVAAATGSMVYSFLGSTEAIVSGGFVTGIGSTGGNARSNFADTSGKGDHLGGSSFNILLRSFVPFQPLGIKLGGFFEYDEFFGADGTGGVGVHHLNPTANDTRTIRKAHRAFGFGITQVVPVGSGFSLDFQQGIAFVRQSIEGVTDQSSGGGPTERFRKEFTSVAPKLGLSIEYQLPNIPLRFRIASEFIYLPSAGVGGFANFSGSPFAFSSRGQWLATNTAGFVVPLNVFGQLN